MSDILFLILRRLRAPLITVIIVYAISVGGLALIPGLAPEGLREPMSIFHAFYVMSYTATTIGFGEIPHPVHRRAAPVGHVRDLSVGDRMGVHAGLRGGARQRRAVSHMLRRSIFNWQVRGLAEPFYVLCGYGQSGSRLRARIDRSATARDRRSLRPIAWRRSPCRKFATPPLTLAPMRGLPTCSSTAAFEALTASA
jgi:hypothetical protein